VQYTLSLSSINGSYIGIWTKHHYFPRGRANRGAVEAEALGYCRKDFEPVKRFELDTMSLATSSYAKIRFLKEPRKEIRDFYTLAIHTQLLAYEVTKSSTRLQ
jgi:hypothetical protein